MFNIPNVIVAGASKCGTTSLYEYFSKHPDIYVPSKKELHYHSTNELLKYINGPGDKFIVKQICQTKSDYLNYYKKANGFSVKIDISPSYLFFPSAIESIKKTCGSNTIIICLVRHPVDKMVSQYSHLLSAGRENLSFEQALANEGIRKKDGYADMWLYKESAFMSEKIKLYKKNFSKVLVLNAHDLYADTAGTLQSIFKFIGIDETKILDVSPVSKNFSGVPKSKLISKVFIQPNVFTNTLRKVIPQKTGKIVREWINSKNKGQKYQVEKEIEEQLEKMLLHEITALNELIDSNTKIKLKY